MSPPLDPTPPPLSGKAPDSEYVPAPHLMNHPFMDAKGLSRCYYDFCNDIKYINGEHGSKLVYERLVANFYTCLQDRERRADARIAAGDKENERLKAEVAVLQARISGMKKKKQAKEKGKETIQPHSTNEQSNRVPEDSGSGASGMDVEHQQADIHRDLEATRSRLLAIEQEYCQQREQFCLSINLLKEELGVCESKNVALQLANGRLKEKVRMLRSKISAVSRSEISMMRRERRRRARTLKKYTDGNRRLNDYSNELEGECQRQAIIIKRHESEIAASQSSTEALNSYVEELKLKAENMEKETKEQAKIIKNSEEKYQVLRLSNTNLSENLEELKEKIVDVRVEQAVKLERYGNENRKLQAEIKKLIERLKAQGAKVVELESNIRSQPTANDQDDSGFLMGMVGFKRKRR